MVKQLLASQVVLAPGSATAPVLDRRCSQLLLTLTLARVARVDERGLAEALRSGSGSRLERVGMVENLISEHPITDLSDLMRGLVGKTKQNMDRMFSEAQREEAVLLLDEATTNVLGELDEAALRHFSFKLRFLTLRAPPREAMDIPEALAGEAAALGSEQRQRLARLDPLAPGDCAAVTRQVEILAQGFEPDEFLAQLEREHRVNPGLRRSRPMGLTSPGRDKAAQE